MSVQAAMSTKHCEYKVTEIFWPRLELNEMNRLSEHGWELVTVVTLSKHRAKIIWKRPVG